MDRFLTTLPGSGRSKGPTFASAGGMEAAGTAEEEEGGCERRGGGLFGM